MPQRLLQARPIFEEMAKIGSAHGHRCRVTHQLSDQTGCHGRQDRSMATIHGLSTRDDVLIDFRGNHRGSSLAVPRLLWFGFLELCHLINTVLCHMQVRAIFSRMWAVTFEEPPAIKRGIVAGALTGSPVGAWRTSRRLRSAPTTCFARNFGRLRHFVELSLRNLTVLKLAGFSATLSDWKK